MITYNFDTARMVVPEIDTGMTKEYCSDPLNPSEKVVVRHSPAWIVDPVKYRKTQLLWGTEQVRKAGLQRNKHFAFALAADAAYYLHKIPRNRKGSISWKELYYFEELALLREQVLRWVATHSGREVTVEYKLFQKNDNFMGGEISPTELRMAALTSQGLIPIRTLAFKDEDVRISTTSVSTELTARWENCQVTRTVLYHKAKEPTWNRQALLAYMWSFLPPTPHGRLIQPTEHSTMFPHAERFQRASSITGKTPLPKWLRDRQFIPSVTKVQDSPPQVLDRGENSVHTLFD